MDAAKLNEVLELKTIEFETAKQLGKPPDELLKIYKELQYQKVLSDHALNVPNHLNVK